MLKTSSDPKIFPIKTSNSKLQEDHWVIQRGVDDSQGAIRLLLHMRSAPTRCSEFEENDSVSYFEQLTELAKNEKVLAMARTRLW